MRHSLILPVIVALLAGQASPVRAQEEARAIVAKAVRAVGGAERLAKFKARSGKAKGTGPINGREARFLVVGMHQFPDQMKEEAELEIQGQKITVTRVLHGDKGWIRAGGQTHEATGEVLRKLKEAMYANYVLSLLPLLEDKAFTLSRLGEVQVHGRAAVGVRVASRGQRDMDLYFDKESGLLVKRANRVLDEALQEVAQEEFYSDYRDVQGIQVAWKSVKRRDGRKEMAIEVIECQFFDRMDARAFAKP